MTDSLALEAIRKKLIGKTLNYKEIYAVMDEIAHDRLGDILTTYFAASGYSKGFSNEELYYLTKAMVETGEKLHFKGIVADKHSTGGVAGSRTTLILVPIIAATGIKIPKASSRAITAPAGTADTMEVLAPVAFSAKQIEKIVNHVGGCIVWGGGFNLAPADDQIIQVEKPLMFESFDKIIISVMAKKIACGAKNVIIDIPIGETMKIKHLEDAQIIAEKFKWLAKKFEMKIKVDIHPMEEPAGKGTGPVLEAKDALLVLEQHLRRPKDLEEAALKLAGGLLDLCWEKTKKEGLGEKVARETLRSGAALKKMKEIIKAQGGRKEVKSDDLKPGKEKWEVKSEKGGRIEKVDNRNINILCRILGTPVSKKAGIYLEKKLGDEIKKREVLFTMYSENKYDLKEAKESLENLPLYKIE